jgi:tetratricopeptide (TPR) repeat protein
MVENNKTKEFLQKLAPCIERGELEKCVDKAARVAGEMGIGAEELLKISTEKGMNEKHDFAYVLALAGANGLKGEEKAPAYFNAGLAAHSTGKMEEAEKHYKKAIEINPKFEDSHYNYAILLNELNRKTEAEEQYKKAIELNPKYAGAYNNYAFLLKELNRKTEAEEQYKKAIEINPKYAEAYNNYANLLIELNRKTEAEEYYKKAIKINPKYEGAHYNYANLLIELNRKTEAEEYYKKAIKINPKFAEAHYNYAFLLIELNRKTEAEEYYKKAIEINSNYAEAHFNYGLLLEELNKKSEAEEHYKKVIEINPNHAAAHNNYANLLREKLQFYEAEKEVRIAVQIAQEDPYAKRILPYARGTLGDILADEGYLEEAKKEYQASLANSHSMELSTTSEIHNKLGWVYAQLKQYNKAKEEFKKALVLDSMNVKAIRNLRALGRVEVVPEISKTQICLAIVLLLSLTISFYLFLINKLSETIFAAQSTIFIALLIFILLYNQLARFKIGTIEFEKSTEHRLMEAKSQQIEALER